MFSKVKRGAPSELFVEDIGLGGSKANSSTASKKSKDKNPKTFADLPQSEFIFKDPGVNDYAERWGAASINSTRMFLISSVMVISGSVAWFAAIKMWGDEKVQPVLVEFNGTTGEYKRPVRVESITVPQAMVKSMLAKWAEYVFTVDPALSLNYLRNADAMTKGRAKGQFAEFRLKTDVLKNLKDGKKLIFAKTETVDFLQDGVAIVNLTTESIDQSGNVELTENYRIRLDYTLTPPTDGQIILRNPIGLAVEVFTYERLSK